MFLSRRLFLQSSLAGLLASRCWPALAAGPTVLNELDYGEIQLYPGMARRQLEATVDAILSLPLDSLLRPFRGGLPTTGLDLGGCYSEPGDIRATPGHAYGAWLSTLARAARMELRPHLQEVVEQMVVGLGASIRPDFFQGPQFPAFTFSNLVGGLLDAYRWGRSATAVVVLDQVLAAAGPGLQGDICAENLYLAGHPELARPLLSETALNSALQAYLVDGSQKYLDAAVRGFDLVPRWATGGWPAGNDLDKNHDSFETGCGSYEHFKLTRGLLRITRQTRYGDSLERVFYNATLGSLPLIPDGRSFSFSDNSYSAKKIYCKSKWPCCSGTLGQVSADYGISSYLTDENGIFVNLYLPSTVNWKHRGHTVALTQTGSYPTDGEVQLAFASTRPVAMRLALRIPAWAAGATVQVNSEAARPAPPGQFAEIDRTWTDGDRVSLHLPLELRLEPLNAQHPEIVALMRGPLVLFPLQPDSARSAPRAKSSELLAARRVGVLAWQVGNRQLRPFYAITTESYSTYFNLS